MKISAGILSMMIAFFACYSAEAAEIRWEGPTQNCDGTDVVGELRYRVHYGPTSRGEQGHPTSCADPCEGPGLEDFEYQNPPLELPKHGDLCDALKPGTWFVAMTAENEAGKTSKYSNEFKVRVEPKEDGSGFQCQAI